MRILYILSGTNMGGATLSFLTLLKSVKKKGEEPFVIIPDAREEFITLLNEIEVPYFVVPMTFFCYPVKGGLSKFFFIYDLIKVFIREIKAEKTVSKIIFNIKPDIIHTNVGPLQIGHFIAKKNNIPHIWHIREYGDLDFNLHPIPSKEIFRKRLREDHPIFITNELAKYNHASKYNEACVIYNGVRSVNEISFHANKQPYFLCASRISPEKGHLHILKAFVSFSHRHPSYRLIILGDGDECYIKELKKFCSEKNINSKVSFKGFQADVKTFMEKATALIVASPAEGFGRMTAEACFDGCLVIGRNTCGTKEILDQTGGFLYEDQADLTKAMETIISLSKERYKELALYAQRTAQNLFSIENYTEKVYSFYQEIHSINKKVLH